MPRPLALLFLLAISSAAFAADPGAEGWRHEELRRFPAAEANQGVAVDAVHFYAIDNHAIGKYRKDTGERVGGWRGEKGGRIAHLNAGFVRDGRLFCAHSNFPAMPAQSSMEIWDAATMQYSDGHPFPESEGALTWVDRREGEWLVCFAHYRKTSDPAKTRVLRFTAAWKLVGSWRFPAGLLARFGDYSASGGMFGPAGKLFVSGHDARELYVLEVPARGEELVWRATIPVSAAGQAFAWDPSESGVLYAIDRKTKHVIVSRIIPPPGR